VGSEAPALVAMSGQNLYQRIRGTTHTGPEVPPPEAIPPPNVTRLAPNCGKFPGPDASRVRIVPPYLGV